MSLTEHARKDECWKTIVDLYNDDSTYLENLTQYSHACQAAALADAEKYDDLTIVACLLHDIGWKLACAEPTVADSNADAQDTIFNARSDSHAARLGILSRCGNASAGIEQQQAQHDVIGATYLRMMGFDEKVPHLVEGHVLAKRYLCFKEPDYFDKLSPASVKTLRFQGGAMTAEEAAIFEQDTLFDLCKKMRRWDEAAKKEDATVPGFEHYAQRVKAAVTKVACGASETAGSYIRDGNKIVGLRSAEDAPAKRQKITSSAGEEP